jgi:glycosyltransferase involved in cell wall biosynthesis
MLERVMRPYTTAVVAASKSEADRAIQDVGFRPDVVRVFWNSIEVEAARDRPSVEERPPDAPRVMFVGRVAYQKNPEMFVRVAALLKHDHPSARFSLVGSGFHDELLGPVQELIVQHGLEGQVELLPWRPREELWALMASATVIVVPSRYESFGYVAAEAGWLGKPVVVTDVDGLRDVVADHDTGFIVPLDDDTAMAECISRLLHDAELARRMGERGRDRVRQCFDIQENIQVLEQIYGDIAGMSCP